MGRLAAALVLCATAGLTACGSSADDQQLGGKVSKAEAQALHDAAEMLEQGRPQPAASAQALQSGAQR